MNRLIDCVAFVIVVFFMGVIHSSPWLTSLVSWAVPAVLIVLLIARFTWEGMIPDDDPQRTRSPDTAGP